MLGLGGKSVLYLGSSFLSGLALLLLKLLLAAPHLVVVVDVAALALALGVEGPAACVNTVSGQTASPVLVVAVVAHALGIERQIGVRACRDLALLAARLALDARASQLWLPHGRAHTGWVTTGV